MDNETLFYICGIVLAVSAVVFSFVGLKIKDFPGKAAPVVVLWFAIFILGATTFGVRYSQEHETAHAAELEHAGEEIEAEETSEPFEEAEEEAEKGEGEHEAEAGVKGKGGSEAAAGGAEETLQLAADESELAFDTTTLSAKAGSLTIDLDNPSSIPHDVAIEKDGEELAKSETVAQSETSATAEVEAGDYIFFCSVPGHREAGMEGTLTVK